jgi:hypothetical protein
LDKYKQTEVNIMANSLANKEKFKYLRSEDEVATSVAGVVSIREAAVGRHT